MVMESRVICPEYTNEKRVRMIIILEVRIFDFMCNNIKYNVYKRKISRLRKWV